MEDQSLRPPLKDNTLFSSNKPSKKLKIIRILLIIVPIFILVQMFINYLEDNIFYDLQLNQSSTSGGLPINSVVWEINFPKDEVKPSVDLIEENLIYAIKNDYISTVYKRNLKSGEQVEILEFTESVKAEDSGNVWSELPPSVALSPDKKQLAFIDKEGLKVYNLDTKTTRTYIRKLNEAKCYGCEPRWSFPLLHAYGLFRPSWSSDGNYISFIEAQYEGSTIGLIDTFSGEYTFLKTVYGFRGITWSPIGHSYLKPSYGNVPYESWGLRVSNKDDVSETTDLTPKISKSEILYFWEANFSPDGERIVFTFQDPSELPDNLTEEELEQIKDLAIIKTDGTDFKILLEKVDVKNLFFSKDGGSIFYFQQKDGKERLVKYELATRNYSDVIVFNNKFNYEEIYWTKDGFLVLSGILSDPSSSEEIKRLFILDIENRKLIYSSPVFNCFTNFVGFSN